MTGAREPGPEPLEIAALDLLLRQGTPAEQDELRRRIGADPLLTLEMADTVTLLERFRELRVEPSARFDGLLADVVSRAERRTRTAPRRRWPLARTTLSGRTLCWALCSAAAAAVATFAGLFHWDPLARRGAPGAPVRDDLTLAAAAVPGENEVREPGAAVVREASPVAWQPSIDEMRRWLGQEPSQRLCDALETGLRPPRDPLGSWLAPRNTIALLRLDHELCATAAVRKQALRRGGGLPGADARVQALADRIAAELETALSPRAPAPDLAAMAFAVRALVAAGPGSSSRSAALARGGDWLAAQLPAHSGPGLVTALAALVEVAAVHGVHGDLIARHGERLVQQVLSADGQNWGRQRPELLSPHVPAATIADGGRLLRLLPGFGVDAGSCALVRQLMLGQLRERADRKDDGPEVLAAMVFGSADLLAPTERDEMELQLRRWHPARLAPDFVTVHQLAWAIEPGRQGFTRLQRDLRQLAVLPEPEPLRDRAAFCLCLATNYAACLGTAHGPSSTASDD